MFFVLVLLVLVPLTYCFNRFWLWMANQEKGSRGYRFGMRAGFLFSAGLLLAAYVAMRSGFPSLQVVLIWLVILLYTFFAVVSVYALFWLLRKYLPAARLNIFLRVFGLLMLVGLVGVSVYNAYTPVVRHIQITIDKPLAKPVTIGLISDTHFGRLFGNRQINKLVDIMDREKPDLIVMAGDVMDDNVKVYRAENMQESLRKLKAPLGVYATLGNHDLYDDDEKEIYEELTKIGIKMLDDQAIPLDNGNFWLLGRPDDTWKGRLPSEKLLLKADTRKPIFLVEHRATSILHHSTLPIDVQMSGHTHNGQIFPANLVAKVRNRLAYGHEKVGRGHYFVTSGYGLWGVPFRLGSQSEVWMIEVSGQPTK